MEADSGTPLVNNHNDSSHPSWESSKGLSILVTATFIGGITSSSYQAIPKAMVDSGWAGIPVLIISVVLAFASGIILGKCWTVLRIRYPQYETEHVSDPYPEIGFRAAGNVGKYATRFCVIATLFGIAVGDLLLISENMSRLLKVAANANIFPCFLVLIFGALLTPFTWFKTPKKFWIIGVICAAASVTSTVLITAGILQTSTIVQLKHSSPSFESFFAGFGIFLFACGGGSIFPTIQVDMKNPDKFSFAVVVAAVGVLGVYLMVSISGFLVLGDHLTHNNVLYELQPGWILAVAIITSTFHLAMVFIIAMNPIDQELDKIFKLEGFTIKRCLIRSAMMIPVVFAALTIPRFATVFSLAGATTITLCTFVFPSLFYILLARQKPPVIASDSPMCGREVLEPVRDANDVSWVSISISPWQKTCLCVIAVFGVIGGVSSTYSVIMSLIDGSSGFTVPCYVNWTAANKFS